MSRLHMEYGKIRVMGTRGISLLIILRAERVSLASSPCLPRALLVIKQCLYSWWRWRSRIAGSNTGGSTADLSVEMFGFKMNEVVAKAGVTPKIPGRPIYLDMQVSLSLSLASACLSPVDFS